MKILQRIKTISDTSKTTLNKLFLRYLVFLCIAMILWYANALRNEYISEVNFPVRYANLPEEKVLLNELPSHLSLKIRGIGFVLLKYKFNSRRTPLQYDLSYSSRLRETLHSEIFYSPTALYADRLAQQLSEGAQILAILPDTLFMEFGDITRKKVAVTPNLSLEYEKQFLPKGKPVITPDSLWVEGPGQILDTLKTLYTRLLVQSKTSDTLSLNVSLEPIPLLSYEYQEVHLMIPVEKHTEAEIEVPVVVMNAPEDLMVRLFPGKVKIICMVGLSDYERLNPFLFKVVADYHQISSNTRKLKLNLLQAPDFVSQLSISPGTVDYLIEK